MNGPLGIWPLTPETGAEDFSSNLMSEGVMNDVGFSPRWTPANLMGSARIRLHSYSGIEIHEIDDGPTLFDGITVMVWIKMDVLGQGSIFVRRFSFY